MKLFGSGNTPFTAPNGDVAEGAAEELTRPTNQFFNNTYAETKQAIESTGQTLTALVADDPSQLAKGLFISGTKGGTFVDSGTANIKQLIHVSGVSAGSMKVPSSPALLDGVVLTFENLVENTGAVTVNVYYDTGLKVIDSAPLTYKGAAIGLADLKAGDLVSIIYSYGSNSFELASSINAVLASQIKTGISSSVGQIAAGATRNQTMLFTPKVDGVIVLTSILNATDDTHNIEFIQKINTINYGGDTTTFSQSQKNNIIVSAGVLQTIELTTRNTEVTVSPQIRSILHFIFIPAN